MGFYLIFVLFILLGAIFGWVAFFRSKRVNEQIIELRQELRALKAQVISLKLSPSNHQASSPTELKPAPAEVTVSQIKNSEAQSVWIKGAELPAPLQPNVAAHEVEAATTANGVEPYWLEHLRSNWMVWLGGVCVALAGIFMVRYSIDQGLLGPTARIFSGLLTGVVLHLGAEWLHRKREPHIAFAALAGGGSITLFAALLSALHLYHMFSPAFVFVLLALVSLFSMLLALRHGPVLAIIGILGAFLVPIFVGGDSGNARFVLIYTLMICSATLLLMTYVQRSWLWLGALAGGLGWWWLTLGVADVDQWRGIYLAVLAWIFVALPERDWLLKKQDTENSPLDLNPDSLINLTIDKNNLLPLTLLCLIGALGVSMLANGFNSPFDIVNWLALPVLLLIVAGKQAALSMHPWLLLLIQLAAILASRMNNSSLQAFSAEELPAFYWFCISLALIYCTFALHNLRRSVHQALWVSLAVISPLSSLALSYLLTSNMQISLQWSLLAVITGAFYLTLATTLLKRQRSLLVIAWLFIGGHLGYSLAAAMYFREAGLTLALALQIVSLSWVIHRFNLKQLDLVLKIVVMAVIARLSLNPWVFEYADTMHWPLLTYVAATLCTLAGSYFLGQRPRLQAWTAGAFLHFMALTIWVILRYVLYEGAVFTHRFELTEAVLNQNIFAGLGLIYFWRARFSEHLKVLCELYAKVLLVLALLTFAVIMLATLISHPWVWQHISDRPILNLILLICGSPVLLACCYWRFYKPELKKAALLFGAACAFVFVSLEIMHLWRGNIRINGSMSDGELYTYSIVWMLMAFTLLLGGVWRYGNLCYRAGLLLLTLVIAKLFLVDMSGLTGLLRVASFMGMGLVLLAIAYLHQKLSSKKSSEHLT